MKFNSYFAITVYQGPDSLLNNARIASWCTKNLVCASSRTSAAVVLKAHRPTRPAGSQGNGKQKRGGRVLLETNPEKKANRRSLVSALKRGHRQVCQI